MHEGELRRSKKDSAESGYPVIGAPMISARSDAGPGPQIEVLRYSQMPGDPTVTIPDGDGYINDYKAGFPHPKATRPSFAEMAKHDFAHLTREERQRAKEYWRQEGGVPTTNDFPYRFCLGWDAYKPRKPPQFRYLKLIGRLTLCPILVQNHPRKIQSILKGLNLEDLI